MNEYLWAVPAAGALALGFAFWKSGWVNRQDAGTDAMKTIGTAIREGAMAFLKAEYSRLLIFVVVVAGLLAWFNAGQETSHALIAVSFVVGALCSGLAGFFGMRVATAANIRTAAAARSGLSDALKVAFSGGAVMGMCVVGLGVLGLGGLFLLYTKTGLLGAGQSNLMVVLNVLSGFSLGASSIALFARVGGGIFTKAADVGADLVGKVEAGIPEDDPRNPATIADNVGDNVGDVAGMGADLFESYVGAIVGSMVIGLAWMSAMPEGNSLNPVILPLFMAGAGIIVSILGTFFVNVKEGGNPQTALNTGTFGAGILMLVVSYFLIHAFLGDAPLVVHDIDGKDHTYSALGVFWATVGGLAAGIGVGVITEFYTSDRGGSVKAIARESQTGPATNVITGLGVGMASTAIPTILIVGAILLAYYNAGLYGIAMAALGMLATTGIQLAVDAYGPIADNAGGIAEMAHLPPEVRQRTDRLDAVGNTTAAIGKGFAIGSAALTALALFAAFAQNAQLKAIDVMDPKVMVGVFVGGMLPFLFSSMAMGAVGRAAGRMIEEVRRQFRDIPGLKEGKEGVRAEYGKCVEISTNAAIKEMVLPGLLAVVAPVLAGLYSIEALGGLLVGCTVGGVMMAIFMSNAGGAWDNAKKYIEAGHLEGHKKGSEAHKAAVIGDTVGDPFKDTAGPSLNILIKLMSVVALVIAPVLLKFHS